MTRAGPRIVVASALLAISAGHASYAAPPSSPDVDKLDAKLEVLAQMVDSLRSEVRELRAENASLKASQVQQQATVTSTREAQATLQSQLSATTAAIEKTEARPRPLENVSLWGYGEIYNMNPVHDSNLAQTDLARAVFGIGYRFDERTRFNSEFEVEHGVSSASDVGEFEVEQFYVDRQLSDTLSARAGLFLIPAGFLNENHEPTHYLGVQRNFVETLIIPSTWREGGISLHQNNENGVRWTAGLTTSQDLSKWNFAPEFVPYRTALELEDNDIAPLQATHQELALANSKHLAQFVSADYAGVPGLDVGGSVFTGKVARNLPNIPDNERATLWEAHARYSPGKWQISALYAQGSFSNTAAANIQNPGTANPIPARFYGWYLETAYNLWQSGDYRLTPFVRYERYNMGSDYQGLAPGFGPRPSGLFPTSGTPNSFGVYPFANDIVSTVGANFYVTPSVVFKLDVQHFSVNKDFSRVDLGMGLAFE
jgi:hypothetical protein